MTKMQPRILIAEEEFLIAIDAEYLIKSAFDCSISLVRPEQLDGQDDEQLKTAALCLLDVPAEPASAVARAERLLALGVQVLLTTVSEFHCRGVPGLPDVQIVTKPYDAEKLLSAVRGMLSR
ncbi:hypothetical protein LXM94_03155 [Rhizobium sp. TRM95111]|uniref:hypothetical protein n=1 Tax=Rhizobium alarense TaxID=2846851 RepID=UPI001F3CB7C3|nr:hypothetical protein [Rhizobium alarense]MCF3638962.1 hypothetical protein [Rhizobium alarense]